MKRIMQVYACVAGLLLAVCMSACSDKDNFSHGNVDAPRFTSFGFYQEDNPGVLAADYVADLTAIETAGTSTVKLNVSMPATVDKTNLIARFTTAEGTTVRVNGTVQTSRTTANNFTVPVDYIIGSGVLNVRYAVTVVKATNMKWTEITPFSDLAVYGDAVMKINPQDGLPYIGFKVRTADDNRSAVIKLTNSGWAYVGEGAFGHKISGSYFDMAFSTDGVPYVAYSDNEAAEKGAMSVQHFDGSTWTYTGGTAGILKAQSNYVSLAVLANGQVVGAQINNSRRADYPQRKLVVSVYKNGIWSSEIPSMLTNDVAMVSAAGGTNAAYLISINRGKVNGVDYGYNVLKYENNTWNSLLLNHPESGYTQHNIRTIGIYVAPDQTPYIWTMDKVSGETGIRLKYYDTATNNWITVGGNILPLGFTPDRHTDIALAVTANGTPFIAYNNAADQNRPYFMYLEPDTRQWSTPAKISDTPASGLSIAFTHSGVGYVTFADSKNLLHTFKYE